MSHVSTTLAVFAAMTCCSVGLLNEFVVLSQQQQHDES